MLRASFLLVCCFCTFSGANKAQTATMTKYVCGDSIMKLSCPDTQVLQIDDALYGRLSTSICRNDYMNNNLQCSSATALDIMASRCNGRTECQFHVGTALFGDPCYGTSKYAEVAYRCMQVEFTQYECDGGVLNLSCPQNHVIRVIWAFYGRTSSLICKNQHSNINLQCQATGTYTIVSSKCNGRQTCQLPVGIAIFEDFCFGTSKYAQVQYICQPQ